MQNGIDLETWLLPPARRAAKAQGRFPFHFRRRRCLAPGLRAHETPRLARQIVEGGFQRFKPPQKVYGGLAAIGLLSRPFAAE